MSVTTRMIYSRSPLFAAARFLHGQSTCRTGHPSTRVARTNNRPSALEHSQPVLSSAPLTKLSSAGRQAGKQLYYPRHLIAAVGWKNPLPDQLVSSPRIPHEMPDFSAANVMLISEGHQIPVYLEIPHSTVPAGLAPQSNESQAQG